MMFYHLCLRRNYYDAIVLLEKMKIITILFLLLALLSGCSSHNIENFNNLDLSDKKMTVPQGGGGLVGAIKSALKNEGWDLAVYSGPKVTEGSLGERTRLKQYQTFNTRYTIFIDYEQFDWRFPDFEPMYHYDISLVDNRKGEEVMTMSGSAARSAIVKKFLEALKKSS
jgi:hypothetical protein